MWIHYTSSEIFQAFCFHFDSYFLQLKNKKYSIIQDLWYNILPLIQWSANQLPVLLDKEISSSNWLANRLALPKPVKRKIKHQTQQYRWAEADSGLIKAPCATIPPQQSHRLIASMRCCTDEVHCAKGAPPHQVLSAEMNIAYFSGGRHSVFQNPFIYHWSYVIF